MHAVKMYRCQVSMHKVSDMDYHLLVFIGFYGRSRKFIISIYDEAGSIAICRNDITDNGIGQGGLID
jgi:hypothetical protein